MITSGAVMNWTVWGALAAVGSYYFLMVAGARRERQLRARERAQRAESEQTS